jgi:hypothetical protein
MLYVDNVRMLSAFEIQEDMWRKPGTGRLLLAERRVIANLLEPPRNLELSVLIATQREI